MRHIFWRGKDMFMELGDVRAYAGVGFTEKMRPDDRKLHYRGFRHLCRGWYREKEKDAAYQVTGGYERLQGRVPPAVVGKPGGDRHPQGRRIPYTHKRAGKCEGICVPENQCGICLGYV